MPFRIKAGQLFQGPATCQYHKALLCSAFSEIIAVFLSQDSFLLIVTSAVKYVF